MNQSSQLKTIGICLGLVILIVTGIIVFRVPLNTVVFGALILACPLMHILMMKSGGHDH